MKKSITKNEFMDEFKSCDRKDNFTYDGLSALYDYIENLYEDCYPEGAEYELDVIALCCEYSEYEDIEEFRSQFGENYETIEDIEQATTVIMISDNSFIIQDF